MSRDIFKNLNGRHHKQTIFGAHHVGHPKIVVISNGRKGVLASNSGCFSRYNLGDKGREEGQKIDVIYRHSLW